MQQQASEWDNSNIYPSMNGEEMKRDFAKAQAMIALLAVESVYFEDQVRKLENKQSVDFSEAFAKAEAACLHKIGAEEILHSIAAFANLALSVNVKDELANSVFVQARKELSQLSQAVKSLWGFFAIIDQHELDSFLQNEKVKQLRTELTHLQGFKDFLLPVAEEKTIEALGMDGFHAWGSLYSNLSGSIKTEIGGEVVGLAKASNIMDMNDRTMREASYRAVNKAWQDNEITAAAILNSIYGWRIESAKLRSKKRQLHYLEVTTHSEKISRQTLDTLMTVVHEQKEIGHRAMQLMAKVMNGNADKPLAPWDLLAPLPTKSKAEPIPFAHAMEIIIAAFREFSPEMAEYAQMAWKKNWIDAKPTENRRTGAFCSTVVNVRETRIFITYEGTIKNLITLAHELGHGYHAWVLRDLPMGEASYSSSVAETASIFAETLTRAYLLKHSKNNEEKKEVLWQELVGATSLLINIPARFEFEKNMMDLRMQGVVSATQIKQLSGDAWRKWYGSTLSEYNEMFWASKMHFSMTKTTFYNYPYLLGYLFSLGIYSEGNKQGPEFKKMYYAILRDTGVLSAEELIMKYFKQDIKQTHFWNGSLQIVKNSLDEFEALL